MKRMVFGESVQGASHKRVDKECQDSFKKLEYDDGTVIMAIADRHGSKACPYSKSGSGIAVNVFCKVMGEFYANYAEFLYNTPYVIYHIFFNIDLKCNV